MCRYKSEGEPNGLSDCDSLRRENDMNHDLIRDLREEIRVLREERRWIPVGERLPKKFERQLIYDPTIPNFPRTNTHVVIGHFRGLDHLISPWHCPDGRGPTHWMPLPPGPEVPNG